MPPAPGPLAAPASPAPPSPPASTPVSIGLGVNVPKAYANGLTIDGAGDDTFTGGDNETVNLAAGGNSVAVHDHANITIAGGNNYVSMHDMGVLGITDARTVAAGFNGTMTFGDTISANNQDTITGTYSLGVGNSSTLTVNDGPALAMQDNGSASLSQTINLGNSDTVVVNWDPVLSLHQGDTVSATNNIALGTADSLTLNYVPAGSVKGSDSITAVTTITAGASDALTFAGAAQTVTIALGGGDSLSSTSAGHSITVAGTATTKSSATVGATAGGDSFNGGLGTDTFSAGAGYTGGNTFIGSAHGNADGFNAIGSCANYSGLAAERVTVNYATGVGTGYNANGNQLWQDSYSNMQQVKAAGLNGNVLTGSDAYYCELKGGNGSVTYYGGAAGDRIIWSEAGATGLLDGQGLDVAFGGSGADEYYWRNQPTGKGVSNFGETINGFSTAKGDDLNFSELATTGFAGVSRSFAGASDLANWVNVSLCSDGTDTAVQFDKTGTGTFTQTAVTLKGDNLFAQYGVADNAAGGQQVALDLYNSGALVLNHTH